MYKLIKHNEDYYLLSDDSVSVGDWLIVGDLVFKMLVDGNLNEFRNNKIIASTCIPELPLINLAKLEIMLNSIDITEVAKHYAKMNQDVSGTIGKYLVQACFIDGYAQCLRTRYDKIFSLNDVKLILDGYFSLLSDDDCCVNKKDEIMDKFSSVVTDTKKEWTAKIKLETDWQNDFKKSPFVDENGYIEILEIV